MGCRQSLNNNLHLKDGGKHTKFDGRPFLGLPAYYKGFTLPKN